MQIENSETNIKNYIIWSLLHRLCNIGYAICLLDFNMDHYMIHFEIAENFALDKLQ